MKLVLSLCAFTMKTYNHYKFLPIINHLIINAMRKSLLLFLVAMVMPVLSFAQTNDNKAISKTARTSMSNSSTSETRGYVDGGVLGYQKAGSTMTGSYTVSAWVNYSGTVTISSTTYNSVILGYGGREHCNDNGQWNLIANGSGISFMGWGIQNISSTSTAMPSGEWAYLTVTYDATDGSLKGYLNGAEVVTATAKNNAFEDFSNENPALYFGAWCFGGSFDELQCWQRVLSADEITAAKVNAQAVSGLTGLYTFNEIKSSTTGQFENTAVGGNTNYVATWETANGSALWDNGVVYVISAGSATETAPTLGEGREIIAAEATVTLTQTTGGTLTVKNGEETLSDGANTVSGGSALTFEATPEAGYALQGIDVTVGEVTTRYQADASYVVVADATITPVWSNTLYALTVVKDDDVTVAVTRSGAEVTDLTALFGGEDYKVAVTVPNEKKLVSVKLGETVLTADADGLYTVNLTEAATLTIETVAKAQYTVTIAQVDGGTITVTDADGNTITSGSTVLEGTVLTVATTANPGYKIETVTANGTQIGTTVTVNGNVEISATFVEGLDYPEMVRFYTNGINQQNRYVKEVTTTGTQTPTVFSATTTAELPYTAVSTYGETNATSNGAVIDKTANPIVITDDVTSFTMTFTAWSDAISSYASELGWSNQAAYIDWNRDGKFNGTNENYASDGEAHSNSHFVTSAYTRTVTIPAGVAPGTYRMRVVYHEVTNPGTEAARTEWVSTFWDGDAPYKLRNGVAYDFDIRIVSSELENPRTVTVASADEEMGTVAITSPATDENSITTNLKSVTMTATAATGASFMNWTDAEGNVVSTDATYTYTGTEDASFTANFGYTVTFEAAPANGTIVVKYNGSAITSGTVVPAGAELTIEATPVNDKMLVGLTANGVSIFEDMSCIVDAATTIVATFGDRIITANVTVVGNGRVVMATEWNTDGTGPDESTVIESGSSISGGVTFFIYPNDDDQLVSVTLEGSNTTEESPYTESADMVDAGNMLYSVAGDAEYPYYVYAEPRDGASEIVLTAVFSGTSTAIDGIEADDENAPVEYFNLQGIRVNSDNLTPGVYVRRQGSKTTKVLVTGK